MIAAEAKLTALIDESRVPGVQYLVMSPSGALFEYAGGWSDLADSLPMTSKTTMMAYSMSKTITAAATLQLVETGILGLDDPIHRYTDSPYGAEVTVRQLIDHTSGIPNPLPLSWVHSRSRHHDFDEKAALAGVLRRYPRLSFKPGSKFSYSNIGYWLLGRIIEETTGRHFVSYVQEQVLTPVGMTPAELGYNIPDAGHAIGYLEKYSLINLIKGFVVEREFIGKYAGSWLEIKEHYLNGPAFGGLVGTARGFGKFLQDQLQPSSKLFGNRVRDLFYTPQQTTNEKTIPMTPGWHVGSMTGSSFFYKEGGGGGFHCLMRLYPRSSVGTVVMTNATGFDVHRLLNQLDPQFVVRHKPA
jgi:D-alanyl-D-alanine carboxypeptidase